MKVLAIDPGPHVGVATWTDRAIEGEGEGAYFIEQWNEFEETPAGFYKVADGWVHWADRVVCEDFFISGARASEANVTIEMIGVLRYLAALHNRPFVTQMPVEAKMFSTKEKLKNIGWYKPAKADHARSATRHLLLYLVKHNHIEGARVLHSAPTPEEV